MMSRDDVYDAARGKQAGIIDSIAKPFESQELIGKVKKALSLAPPRLSEPAPRPTAPAPPSPAGTAWRPPAPPVAARPSKAAPSDILDIIQEAPTEAELKQTTAPAEEEAVYEVEPEVEEVMEPLAREIARALPVGEKAVEEMRAGLGLTEDTAEASSEIVPFESFEMEGHTAAPPRPAVERPAPAPAADVFARTMKESGVPAAPRAPDTSAQPKQASLSEDELRGIAEKTIAAMAEKIFKTMPPPALPKISDDTVRRGIEEAVTKIAREIARDIIERVAWEVIPPLAEQLIKAEIERLKALEP
jgi:hypothetical protein